MYSCFIVKIKCSKYFVYLDRELWFLLMIFLEKKKVNKRRWDLDMLRNVVLELIV